MEPEISPVWALLDADESAGGDDDAGRALAAKLESETIPRLKHLVVRENLLSEIKSQETMRDRGRIMGMRQRFMDELILQIDDGPEEEVIRLYALTDAFLQPPYRDSLTWYQDRLAQRGLP